MTVPLELTPLDAKLIHSAKSGPCPTACWVLGFLVGKVSLVGEVEKCVDKTPVDGTPTMSYWVNVAGRHVTVIQRLPKGGATDGKLQEIGAHNVICFDGK